MSEKTIYFGWERRPRLSWKAIVSANSEADCTALLNSKASPDVLDKRVLVIGQHPDTVRPAAPPTEGLTRYRVLLRHAPFPTSAKAGAKVVDARDASAAWTEVVGHLSREATLGRASGLGTGKEIDDQARAVQLEWLQEHAIAPPPNCEILPLVEYEKRVAMIIMRDKEAESVRLEGQQRRERKTDELLERLVSAATRMDNGAKED